MRALITGGAGFIGSHLAEELLSRGTEVTCLDNLSSGRRNYVPSGAAFVEKDIESIDAADLVGVDHLFHLAARPFIPDCYKEPESFYEVNAKTTFRLLGAAKQASVKRLLFVSTSEVYGSCCSVPDKPKHHPPMTEDHRINPQSTYAASKLAAERLAYTLHCEQGIPVVIFRPFNCYGPRATHPYVIPHIISELNRGNVVHLGNVESRRDFTYVSEMAYVMAEVLARGVPGETYHYGTGIAIPIKQIVEDVAHVMGKGYGIAHEESRMRPNDVHWLRADPTKTTKLIGPIPPSVRVNWHAGLRQMIDWFHANGSRWAWEL